MNRLLYTQQPENEEAFYLYKSVFGREIAKIIRFKDLSNREFQIAENEANKLFNGLSSGGQNEIQIGKSP